MIFRRDAAALVLTTTAIAVCVLALSASAGLGQAADVKLQVIPRGPGTVTSSVPDKTTGATACTKRSEPEACDWTFAAGATVVLTATPNGSDASFTGWSTPDCPGTAACRLTLDDDQSVVALFSKLTLVVQLSGDNGDERITSEPPGIDCPTVTCEFDFPARSTVRLTVSPGGSTLTSFPFGCTSVEGRVCLVTMLDDPQTVGVQFNNAGGPDPPELVDVSVRVRKSGDGAGRVIATGFDCGGTCSAKFKYGRLESFTVVPDPGSLFGGWGGICAADKALRCTLPIGPITLLRPRFDKEAPPTAPGALSTSSATESTISVGWGASTDDTGVRQYEVFVGDEPTPRVSTSTTTANLAGLVCGTTYAIAVQAVDGAGNRSARTSAQLATAACPLRVQLLGANVVRARAVRRLAVRLKSSVATKGSCTLFVGGKRVLRASVALRKGTNALSYRMPQGSGRRNVRLLLRLADPKGGVKTLTYRLTVRT